MKLRRKIAAITAGGCLLIGSVVASTVAANAVNISDTWMQSWSSGSTNKTANLKKKTSTNVGSNYGNDAGLSANLEHHGLTGTTIKSNVGFTIKSIQLCKDSNPPFPYGCGPWRQS